MLERVDFGYGLLGHIEKGGTFEFRREQVSDTHWKASLIEVHIQGRVLLLRNVTKISGKPGPTSAPFPTTSAWRRQRNGSIRPPAIAAGSV